MNKWYLFLLLLVAPVVVSAQQAVDVIYLNNGNIVKGEITSSNDTSVAIRSTNGELYTFERVAIRRIDNGEQLASYPKAPKSRYVDHSEREKGFWAAVDFMAGANVEHEYGISGAVPLDLQVTFGYRFSEFLQVGVGAGFRYYANNDQARCYHNSKGEYENYGWAFPIYGQLRGLFYSGQSRSVVPFWQLTAGHTVNDGFMCSPALGLRFGTAERHHFNLGLHYTAQWTQLQADASGGHLHRFGPLHILQLRLGYQF